MSNTKQVMCLLFNQYLKIIFKSSLVTCFWLSLTIAAHTQSLTITFDADTIAIDDVLVVQVTMENLIGNYTPPTFEDFEMVYGPNMASSFSMINGATTQSKSYSYGLKPKRSGELVITGPFVTSEDHLISAENVTIFVQESSTIKRKNAQSFQYKGQGQTPKPDTKTTKKRVLKRI